MITDQQHKKWKKDLVEIHALCVENKRLKEENRWIPVTERLPEKTGYYFTYEQHDNKRADVFYYYVCRLFSEWRCCDRKTKYACEDLITFWKPIILPEEVLNP